MSKRCETSKQVPDAQLVNDSEPTKLDDLDGGEIIANRAKTADVFHPHLTYQTIYLLAVFAHLVGLFHGR